MSKDPQIELIEEIAKLEHKPLEFCRFAFPWSEKGQELEQEKGLRAWQKDFFNELGEHLQNEETRHTPFLYAVSSGHGIGKSALIGMLCNWGLSTCVDTKIVITSNTETQLRTKTMPEVSKWFRLAINAHWWTPTATAIFTKDKKHIKAWRLDAIPWSMQNTEAFAGLHNKKKRIILIFDEASAIHDKVWEVAEGALTDEETEIIWIAFGNPTRNTGRFRECFRKYRHLWKQQQIDSRDVEGTNKDQINKWVDTYGLDSDFVKVRVRGQFPSQSFKQFISSADVDAAYDRELKPESYQFAPKIITVDPSWQGDDEFVIAMRQGLHFEILKTLEKNDNDLEMAALIAQIEDEKDADAVFIDAGYGTGIVSAGKTMRRNWQLVWFGSKATDAGCINKRAEMWREARDWLKEGGSIPKDTVLAQELTSPEAVPRGDGKIQIESKKEMKARGIPSPNRADALILSFAYPVKQRDKNKPQRVKRNFHSQGWMG